MEKKTTEPTKPIKPIGLFYADLKQALTRQIGNTMAAYGLPIFMAEGVLSGILAEIRTNAVNELADDTAKYEDEMKNYYEARIKQMEEQHQKEKDDLIREFEHDVLGDETDEIKKKLEESEVKEDG